jgi:hypothetical protein
LVIDLSAPGWTSGRVDATTSTFTTPLRPWFASSATPMPMAAVVFFFAVSATFTVSFWPEIVAVVPSEGLLTTE